LPLGDAFYFPIGESPSESSLSFSFAAAAAIFFFFKDASRLLVDLAVLANFCYGIDSIFKFKETDLRGLPSPKFETGSKFEP
jgi:hypothetical protein